MKKIYLIGALMLVVFAQACINNNTDDSSVAYTRKEPIVFIEPVDKQFANDAAHINMAEIELGKLAIKKGSDKRIKNFGAILLKQHNKINIKLQVLAKAKKIDLPVSIDSTSNNNLVTLATQNGKAFDQAFLAFIITDHQNNIKLFEQASKHAVDPDLRKIADKNLLIFKRHLDMIDVVKKGFK
jgi:putative membrane protein